MKTEIQKKNNSKTLIKFPVLEGDSQIYLGQTIVTLVRMGIENNNTYSDEIQHRFKVELMASVLSELDVTLDKVRVVLEQRLYVCLVVQDYHVIGLDVHIPEVL